MDQRMMERRQAAQPVNPAIGPRVAGPSQARLEALSESVNNGPTVQRTAAMAVSLARRAPDLGPGVVQRQFDSIREARDVAGDPQGDATRRVEAETHLRQTDAMAEAAIRALVQNGDLQQALGRAAVLAGLPPGRYDIRPTADYNQVVGGAQVPRVASGVTVTESDAPVIYILDANIRRWVNGGDIGDLLATIRHEATHADQNQRQGGRRGEDEREFEAYAAEITHAGELFDAGEDSLAPSSAHLAVSHQNALEHYAALPQPVPPALVALRQSIDARYARLQRYLQANDRESGRFDRIIAATRTALLTYINDPTTEYPSRAYNDYERIPEDYRRRFDAEFNPLFDKLVELRRPRR